MRVCVFVNQENFWKLVLSCSYGCKDPTQVVRFRLHEFLPSEPLKVILEQFVALRAPYRYLGQIPSPPRPPANLALTPFLHRRACGQIAFTKGLTMTTQNVAWDHCMLTQRSAGLRLLWCRNLFSGQVTVPQLQFCAIGAIPVILL